MIINSTVNTCSVDAFVPLGAGVDAREKNQVKDCLPTVQSAVEAVL